MPADYLRKVGYDDGNGIDYRIPVYFRHFPLAFRNPLGRYFIGRLYGIDAFDGFGNIARVESQVVIHKHFSPGYLFSFNLYHVLIGVDQRVIPEPYRGHHHAHIHGKLLSKDYDPIDKAAAAGLIHQGQQGITELHFYRLNPKQVVDVVDIAIIICFALFVGNEALHLLLFRQPLFGACRPHQYNAHGD